MNYSDTLKSITERARNEPRRELPPRPPIEADERLSLPSASAMYRYELCPGSFQLEQEAKRLNQLAHQASEAAARGERIHAYLAGLVDKDDNEIKLSESEQTTADFLQERATGEVKRIFGDEKVQQLDERRFWLIIGGQRMASGRCDRVLYTSSVALCQDFKTGFSEPDPAEQNSQLKLMAVLVALHLPTVKEVIVQIVSGAFGVTEARYDLPMLATAYSDLVATLRSIHQSDAPLKPSPKACRYCPAINVCQAVRTLSNPLTRLQVSALPLDGKRAAQLLDECAVLQGLIDSVKEHYGKRLTEDPSYRIPGYEMVQGAPRRFVLDWLAARQKLEEFIDPAKLDELADYSIPAVEKLLGEAIGVKGQKLKEQFASILGDLLQQKYPALSLKRVNGKPLIA